MTSLTAWYILIGGGMLVILVILALAWFVERGDA